MTFKKLEFTPVTEMYLPKQTLLLLLSMKMIQVFQLVQTDRSAEQTNSTLSTYSFHEVLNDIGMMIGTEKMPVTHTCTESTVEVVNKENMPQRSLNMIVPITVTLSNSEAQNYPLVKEIS